MKSAIILILLLVGSYSLSLKLETEEQSKPENQFSIESFLQKMLNQDYDETQYTKADDLIYRFFVIGDFGWLSNFDKIGKVTNIMNNLAKKKNYSHMITTGDNFYLHGIRYIWNRFLPWIVMSQFKKSAIKNLPMYVTLGNHDCYGSVKNAIEFTKYDNQYNLESEYYIIAHKLLDDPDKYFINIMLNSCKLYCATSEFADLNGECAAMHETPGSDAVREHYNWLEEMLFAYDQDDSVAWLAVSMHHSPFILKGEKKYLLPMLRRHKVDFMFIGHDHWMEYSNMDPNYEIRFPDSEKGPVIDDCHDKVEILNTDSRSMSFKKGEKLHEFLIGSGGAPLISVCPYYDQDGDVIFRSVEGYGTMSVEATSTTFNATYYIEGTKERFNVYVEN